MFIEIFGFIAGVVVMLSYVLDGLKLRIANVIGSVLMVIYSVMLHSISLTVLNGLCIVIHLYYILKEEKNHEK